MKTKNSLEFFCLIFVMLLAVIINGCGSQSDVKAKPGELKIGVLFPLTGDAASYGKKGQKAIDLAVKAINAKGGINGNKVAVIYEDSRAEPKTGVTAIRKLINIDHVPAVIGGIVSAVTLPCAPIAEENQVILLSPTSSAPAITDAGEFIYRIWPSDLSEGQSIARFAKEQGYNNIAILHQNNDYGLNIAKIFKEEFEIVDAHVVLMEGYLKESNDFRTILSKIEQSEIDAIYIAGYYADTSKIIRQAYELGIKTQFLGTTAIEDDKFLELSGNSAEGIIYPLATGFDPASESQIVRDFIRTFEDAYNYQPGWVEAQAYDSFMLICEAAIHIPGVVEGNGIKAYFDGMGEYQGVTGKIKFDENGDVLKSVVFKTVRDGKFQPLVNKE